MYLVIIKVNGYVEESNGNKYLTLFSAVERKDTQKNYEELWNQIRDLIRSISNCLQNCKLNNPEHFDRKYMKIKFNSDDDLPLKNANVS